MVEYTAEERARIAALTVYEDRPGRKGGRRKPRRPDSIPVGRSFTSSHAIIYREGSELVLYAGDKRFVVHLRTLVPAEQIAAYVSWTCMLGRTCQPRNASYLYSHNKSVDPRWLPGERYQEGGSLEERRIAFENFLKDVEFLKGGPLVPGDEISRGFRAHPHTIDEGGYWPTNIEVLSRDEHTALLKGRNAARRARKE